MVEVWHEEAGEHASAVTDADGRFMFATVMPPRDIQCRVTHEGRSMPARRLHFAQPQRDEKGAWRATFGLTLA